MDVEKAVTRELERIAKMAEELERLARMSREPPQVVAELYERAARTSALFVNAVANIVRSNDGFPPDDGAECNCDPVECASCEDREDCSYRPDHN